MKALVTNACLESDAETEIVVRDLAIELRAKDTNRLCTPPIWRSGKGNPKFRD